MIPLSKIGFGFPYIEKLQTLQYLKCVWLLGFGLGRLVQFYIWLIKIIVCSTHASLSFGTISG